MHLNLYPNLDEINICWNNFKFLKKSSIRTWRQCIIKYFRTKEPNSVTIRPWVLIKEE